MSELKNRVLDIIHQNQHFVTKKELTKILGIKGAQRTVLNKILTTLASEGLYGPKINNNKGTPPKVRTEKVFSRGRKNLRPISSMTHFKNEQLNIIGLFCAQDDRCWIESVHRKGSFAPIPLTRFDIENLNNVTPENNDVIVFNILPEGQIKIADIIGNIFLPKVFSLIAIYNAQVPFQFSEEARQLAQKGQIPPLNNRTDLRDLPLVTIDGEDARDFDDAVYARGDEDPANPGGWIAIVAIADVSYYVRPLDALDKEAYQRGNSIYFADRVVPMLPEDLSNGLCSLKPHEDRACIAVELKISKNGKIVKHHFMRALMKSKARLTYTQVQNSIDNYESFEEGSEEKFFFDDILKPLYGVYKTLRKARDKRGALDLDSLERKVIFDETGKIKKIVQHANLESHQLIEELMVAANVAAAEVLSKNKWPTLYRIHNKPDESRVLNMTRIVIGLNITVPKDKKFLPQTFNTILNVQTPFKRLIHDLVLRAQAQAVYSPHNVGHFGLGLSHYTHFTSPIRRYADLCVHRALISALGLGEDGQNQLPIETLEEIGLAISATERKAAQLEREVMDRYLVLHLEDQVGFSFDAHIVGVTSVGIFFELELNGAQGFLHKKNLPDDYYIFEEDNHRYIGKRTKRVFQLGSAIHVILEAADSRSATTVFSLSTPVQKKSKCFKKHSN